VRRVRLSPIDRTRRLSGAAARGGYFESGFHWAWDPWSTGAVEATTSHTSTSTDVDTARSCGGCRGVDDAARSSDSATVLLNAARE
jgi:hypothetical protein